MTDLTKQEITLIKNKLEALQSIKAPERLVEDIKRLSESFPESRLRTPYYALVRLAVLLLIFLTLGTTYVAGQKASVVSPFSKVKTFVGNLVNLNEIEKDEVQTIQNQPTDAPSPTPENKEVNSMEGTLDRETKINSPPENLNVEENVEDEVKDLLPTETPKQNPTESPESILDIDVDLPLDLPALDDSEKDAEEGINLNLKLGL